MSATNPFDEDYDPSASSTGESQLPDDTSNYAPPPGYQRDPNGKLVQIPGYFAPGVVPTPGGAPGQLTVPAGTPGYDPKTLQFTDQRKPPATTPTPPADSGDLMGRIKAALAAAGSTDDPNYWYGVISKDPNGAGSAWDYWTGRINQGDGAAGVRNGTVKKFDDGSGDANPTATPSPFTPKPYVRNTLGGKDTSAQADALYNMLMQRAQQGLNIDPNDPIIRQQADAYNANTTRSGRQYLQGLAEKQGANANIGSEGRMVAEKGAQAGATFEGQLMQQELTARRTEIQNALTGAAGLLTAQQQMDLQKELADLDHQQQLYEFDYGQKQNQSQFDKNMTQRAYEFDSTDRFRNSPLGSKA